MLTRSMMFALAVGSFAAGCVGEGDAEEATGMETEYSSSPWTCQNAVSAVTCNGYIALLPISVEVKNVRILNDAELNLLSDSLNDLSILSGNETKVSNILKNVELTVLDNFLNDFNIYVTKNDIKVCAVLSVLSKVCK